MEKREHFYSVGWNVNWYSHCGEQYGCSLKTKNRITIWPNNPTPGHMPRENHNSKRYIHPRIHCSTVYNSQDKQPKCPSAAEWIKKMWYIFTMEYYSAIKRNATGSFVEMWMDLESVILSEVRSSTSFSFQHTVCPTQAGLAPSRRTASWLKGPHCSGPPTSAPSSTRIPARILTCSLLSSVHPVEKNLRPLFIYLFSN